MNTTNLKGTTMVKVTGILLLVFGGIGVISSLISLFAFLIVGLLGLLESGCAIAAGVLGVAYCRKREKAGVCLVLGCIVMALYLLGGIVGIVYSRGLVTSLFDSYYSSAVNAGATIGGIIGLILRLIVPGLYTLGAVMNMRNVSAANAFQEVKSAGEEAFREAAQAVRQNVGASHGTSQPQAAPADTWTCSCGYDGNGGNFCLRCGKGRPAEPEKAAPAEEAAPAGWTCSCGAAGNVGNFCPKCGGKKPEEAPQEPPKPTCPRCGWQPEVVNGPVHFCLRCGAAMDNQQK